MGILDDAIREHLELKRAHGADETEVRRKELEAFGQAAQATAEPAAATAEPAAAADDEHTQLLTPETHVAEPAAPDIDALQPAPEDPYEVHPGDEPVADPNATGHFDVEGAAEAGAGTLDPTEVDPGPPPPAPPSQRHPTDEHPALMDHDRIHHEEHPPEPVFRRSAEAVPAPVDDPPVGDPPVVEPDIDEPPPRQSPEPADEHEVGPIEGPSDDVLEDTPEFLQDAPEHDRLWFEQKPPRDFDFGE